MKVDIKITEKEDQNNLTLNGKRIKAVDTENDRLCVDCVFNHLDNWICCLLDCQLNLCNSCDRRDKRNIVWKQKEEEIKDE